MEIDLLFKIAGMGILVAVLNQVLSKAGREDQAMMITILRVIVPMTAVAPPHPMTVRMRSDCR